jgi:hypothetical protein
MSPNRKLPFSSPVKFVPVVLQVVLYAVLLMVSGAPMMWGQTQSATPFEVENPKKQSWGPAEARRIYNSACNLVARSIRPDKPPHLEPRFRLVLGTDDDEFVRDGSVVEIHLKSWNAEKFAEGVVYVAIRDVLQSDDLARIAHQSVVLADSTLDVHELPAR